jgi:hypothetical protein
MTHGRLAIGLTGLCLAGAAATTVATGAFAGGRTRLVVEPAIVGPTVGPGRVSATYLSHGYRVALRLTPNRPLAMGTVSMRLTKNGRVVRGASIRLALTMLDMQMAPVRASLAARSRGRYERKRLWLAMPGRWGLSFSIAPPHVRAFSVTVIDRVGA